jgi:hypothetical protein
MILGYFFPFFFIGMWILASYSISKKGWQDLAEKYALTGYFTGASVGLISAGINGFQYNNCLILKYNGQGMYLVPIFLFRLFHKPIFIPWNEIKDVRKKKLFFVQLDELIIGDPFVATIRIKESTFRKIENFIPASQPKVNSKW